jgi:hypothetical protein
MSENPNPSPAATPPPETAPTEPPASSAPSTDWPVLEESAPSEPAASSPPPSDTSTAADQSGLAAPRGLSYAVDIVFCIDVTGSMTPIIDQVKANALRFYDDVQSNLTTKGKNVDQLRVRVIGFRDFVADGAAALDESPFFTLPDDRADFSAFVNRLPVDDDRGSSSAGDRRVDRPAGPTAQPLGAASRHCDQGAGRLQCFD